MSAGLVGSNHATGLATIPSVTIARPSGAGGGAGGGGSVQVKAPVRAASTANVNLIGGPSAGQVMDGVTLAYGDRVLLKNQTNAALNSIWEVGDVGGNVAADADSAAELQGAQVFVQEGSQAGTTWAMATPAPILYGTTALSWEPVPTAPRKAPVRVASTANVSLTIGLWPDVSIDGVHLAQGDRVLLKDQSNPAQNGIWEAADGGGGRTPDANAGAELLGAIVPVTGGATQADTTWACSTAWPLTLGTTPLQFVLTATVPAAEVAPLTGAVQLPVQLLGPAGRERPAPVTRQPKATFPQPVALGETAARRNYDIDEFAITDWTGGMGLDHYVGPQGANSYASSTAETRYPGVLACAPLASVLGTGTIANLATAPPLDTAMRVLETGLPGASRIVFNQNEAGNYVYRLDAGLAWQSLVDPVDSNPLAGRDVAQAQGYLFIVAGSRLFRSADGVTWSSCTMTLPAESSAITGAVRVVAFDNRLWVLGAPNIESAGFTVAATVFHSENAATVAPGSVTFTRGAAVTIPSGETLGPLFTWVDPSDNERPALWLQTERRLFFLDYYAQTPAWQEWLPVRNLATGAGYGTFAAPWPKNKILYAGFGKPGRTLYELTARTTQQVGPNIRYGLPSRLDAVPLGVAGNTLGLYTFLGHPAEYTAGATNNGGMVAVMAEAGGGFHYVFSEANNNIVGGGIGDTTLYVVGRHAPGQCTVWSIDLANEQALPQLAPRNYSAAPAVWESSWIDCGFRNVWKSFRYLEVDCVKDGGDVGLNIGATVAFDVINRKGLVVTRLGTLNASSVFPAVLPVPANLPAGRIDFKECRLRATLQRGGGLTASPFVRALKLGYRPRPKQRYAYAVRIDVRDDGPAFATADGLYHGNSASRLRAFLDGLADNDDPTGPDPLVSFSYGGYGNLLHPTRRTIPECEVLITAQESPDGGQGLYLAQLSDVTPPVSG